MKTMLLLLMMCSAYGISVDNEILIPLSGDKIYMCLSANGTLQVSRTKGPDFNVFYIQPIGIDGGWSMSIYDGAHPKGYEDEQVIGEVTLHIGDKAVVGRKYIGKNGKPFVVVSDKYNKNDVIQVYIAFSDVKTIESAWSKVPQVKIVRN